MTPYRCSSSAHASRARAPRWLPSDTPLRGSWASAERESFDQALEFVRLQAAPIVVTRLPYQADESVLAIRLQPALQCPKRDLSARATAVPVARHFFPDPAATDGNAQSRASAGTHSALRVTAALLQRDDRARPQDDPHVSGRRSHAGRRVAKHLANEPRIARIAFDQQGMNSSRTGGHVEPGRVTVVSQKSSIDLSTVMNCSRSTGFGDGP